MIQEWQNELNTYATWNGENKTNAIVVETKLVIFQRIIRFALDWQMVSSFFFAVTSALRTGKWFVLCTVSMIEILFWNMITICLIFFYHESVFSTFDLHISLHAFTLCHISHQHQQFSWNVAWKVNLFLLSLFIISLNIVMKS